MRENQEKEEETIPKEDKKKTDMRGGQEKEETIPKRDKITLKKEQNKEKEETKEENKENLWIGYHFHKDIRTITTTKKENPTHLQPTQSETHIINPNPNPKETPQNHTTHKKVIKKVGKSTYTIGNIEISEQEIKILDKGLSFIPNIKEIELEIEEIEKKVDRVVEKTIKEYKGGKWKKEKITTLGKTLATEASIQYQTLRQERNLTYQEILTLKSLKMKKEIIIKPIDKNLGTATIEKDFYIREVETILKNPNNYKQLKKDPTLATIKKLDSLIENLNKEKKLSKKIAKKIKPSNETTAGRFYTLPKIHKPSLGWRPIVSNNQHPTENLSKWISSVLTPTSKKAKTYIENSYAVTEEITLIDKTAQKRKKNWLIITADIENLYTNIPHRDGVESCIETLYNDQDNKLKLKDPKAMKALIHNTLTNNIFEFNNKYYTQIQGTAMGTSMAPAYANIYLGNKEEKYLEKTKLKPNMLSFKRYLDDILIIYDNEDESLPKMLEELKELYKPLKITIEYGKKLPFLDLSIEIDDDKLLYNMYRKPLNAKEIIPYNSCHPKTCKEGTIVGELKRIRKLNSTSLTKRKEEIKLIQRCLRQNYPYKEIQRIKRKAKRNKRIEAEEEKKVYLTLTYNPKMETIGKEIQKKVEEARKKQEEKEGKAIPKIKLITSYRTQPNLKAILTRARVN